MLLRLLVVWMLVLIPFVRGWRVIVRASCSADSTSVGLSYHSVIAQTPERNYYSAVLREFATRNPGVIPTTESIGTQRDRKLRTTQFFIVRLGTVLTVSLLCPTKFSSLLIVFSTSLGSINLTEFLFATSANRWSAHLFATMNLNVAGTSLSTPMSAAVADP